MKSKVLLVTLVLLSLIAVSATAMAAPVKKPTVSFTGTPTSGYAPLKVQFTSKTTNNPTSYTWIFEPQSSSDWNSHHAVTAQHTFENPGTYTISCTVTNKAGNATYTKTKYITVLSKPLAKPTSVTFTATPLTGSVPLTVIFTSKSSGGTPTAWGVAFGDGVSSGVVLNSNTFTVYHTYKNQGVYTVAFDALNSVGDTAVAKANYITVTAPVAVPISCISIDGGEISTPTYIYNAQDRIRFVGCLLSGDAPTSWNWNLGDGTTSISQNPTHAYTKAGTYTVTLKTSNAGGSYSSSKKVIVQPYKSPIGYFATDIVGNTVQFYDQSTNSPSSWFWAFGDGTYSSLQNPIHNYPSSGTYPLTLTVANKYGSNTRTFSFSTLTW